MRISDWSSDVCSSDLIRPAQAGPERFFYNKWLGEFCRVARPLPFPICITAPLASQHEGDGIMADNRVSLFAAVRTNLLTLQRTARQIDITQTRLSPGLKVNSAIDDATAFFTPRPLHNQTE